MTAEVTQDAKAEQSVLQLAGAAILTRRPHSRHARPSIRTITTVLSCAPIVITLKTRLALDLPFVRVTLREDLER